MSVGLLVVAAGPGSRLKCDVPKALVHVAGVPLLVRTVRRFECVDLVDGAVVVVPPEHRRDFEEIVKEAFPESSIQVVDGGAERQVSVAKGLAAIDEGTEWVAIHDAARPFVGAEAIRKAIQAAQMMGAATVAVPCEDTILESDEDGMLAATPDRNQLWACQTPQVFALEVIRAAHEKAGDLGATYTDDATLVRAAGHEVKIVRGSPENIKITTQSDLAFAEFLIREGAV